MTRQEYDTVCEIIAQKIMEFDHVVQHAYCSCKDEKEKHHILEHFYSKEFEEEYERCIKAPLNDEPWRDGKHLGDCTGDPCPCSRCIYEGLIEEAQEILQKTGIVVE